MYIFVIAVVTELILYKEKNSNTAGDTDGKAGDIDKRVTEVAFDIPVSSLKIITEHCFLLPFT
jgi:hypothetical protein